MLSYDYAVVRVVPRVEREEFLIAGVIFYCRGRRLLTARIVLDRARLAALASPEIIDPDEVEARLRLIPLVCAGGPAAGALGALSQQERFHWLTTPRSTVIQTSAPHSGLCADPEEAFVRLADALVGRVPARET